MDIKIINNKYCSSINVIANTIFPLSVVKSKAWAYTVIEVGFGGYNFKEHINLL